MPVTVIQSGRFQAAGGGGAPVSWTFSVTSTYTPTAASLDGYTGTQSAGSGGLADGVYDTAHSCWASNQAANSAITADFGSTKTLTTVHVAPAGVSAPGGWDVAYLNGCVLEYSTDGSSWTTIATISGASVGVTQSIGAGGVSARYVRIRRAANDYVALSEFWFD